MNKRIILLLMVNLLWLAFWGIERNIAVREGDYYASGSASVEEFLIKCNTLSEQGFGNNRDDCLLVAVKLKKDFDICDEMTGSWSRWRCFNLKLENNLEVTAEDCEKLEYFKDDCLKKLAEKSNNINYCLTISAPMGIARCGANMALAQKDISVCDSLSKKIASFDNKDNPVERCVSYYLQTENFADCNNVTNEQARDKCYYAIARNNLDDKYCEMISGTRLKGACLRSMEFWKSKKQ